MRPLWERYYADADAVVFVLDVGIGMVSGRAGRNGGSQSERLGEVADAFRSVAEREELVGVPLLVFGNKTDCFVSDDPALRVNLGEILAALSLGPSRLLVDNGDSGVGHPPALSPSSATSGDRTVLGCTDELVAFCCGSAKTGEGVKAAFEWLVRAARMAQRERQ